MIMKFSTLALTASLAALTLAACGKAETPEIKTTVDAPVMAKTMTVSIDDLLAAQPDEVKARYQYRHPKETLEFFGVKPGMTVAEVLPGKVWYSQFLLPIIGDEGTLIGVDYPVSMWGEFDFASDEFIAKKKDWPATWVKGVKEWRGENTADLAAFTFGARDTSMDGKVDAVLFIRALHNLSRFNEKGGYLTQAFADSHALLKTGGTLGIIQHRAPESTSAEWAKGQNGYLKQSDLIRAAEAAGFSLEAKSEINANPKDVPSEANEDIVWRLPPSLATSAKDDELKAKMIAIGESDRMTLKFVKK